MDANKNLCFAIYSNYSCDGPHAVSLGNEANPGFYRGFVEGYHLGWGQLLHLTLGEVTPKIRLMGCERASC